MKKLTTFLTILLVFLLCLPLILFIFMRSSVAPMDGSLQIKGLSDSVKVSRDTYGVPHIQAGNKLDALKALGFVVASERLFQMEIQRRFTQGQLSEVFGEVALKNDKLYRSLMIRRSVERMLEKKKRDGTFDDKVWAEMEAYCAGINAYIETQNLPYEFTFLGIEPKPFTPMDAYIVTGYMAFSFSIATKADTTMTTLAKKLSHDEIQDLRNNPLPGPLKVAQTAAFSNLLWSATQDLVPAFEGSNAWLLAPSRSASGRSLFANDPHIAFSLPNVWFEAHITTPEFELYGHYLPLVPFAVLGHNRHHAWGFTMSLTDDMDLYREKVDVASKTTQLGKSQVPYQEWEEEIPVKAAPSVVLKLKETVHGPLLDEVLDEKGLALKWAFYAADNDPMSALNHMAEAKTMDEFKHALNEATAPGLNVMYADAQNIAWWVFGDMPVKKNPNSDFILDGASGQDEYLKILNLEERPHLVNPPDGVIVTANSRPESLPANIRGDYQADDRYKSIHAELARQKVWSVEDAKKLQTMNWSVETEKIVQRLLGLLPQPNELSAEQKEAVNLLINWDRHSTIDSKAAAIFHQWNNENILLLLSKLSDLDRENYLNTPYAWVFYKRVLFKESSPWWKERPPQKLVLEGLEKALVKLKQEYGKDYRWGRLHTVEYQHPLGRMKPLNHLFNLGPFPMPGAYNEINNNRMPAMGSDFKVRAGPSTRRIIDFGNPTQSWGILPVGNSGHMLSPYYKDQVFMFLEGQYRPQMMNAEDILKDQKHELILVP